MFCKTHQHAYVKVCTECVVGRQEEEREALEEVPERRQRQESKWTFINAKKDLAAMGVTHDWWCNRA